MLLDLASGRITPLTGGLDRDMQETWAVQGVYPGMSWTPDNKSIVYWAQGGIKRVDVASGQVSDIPFHVSGTRFVEDAVRQQKGRRPSQLRREYGPLRQGPAPTGGAWSMKRSAIFM